MCEHRLTSSAPETRRRFLRKLAGGAAASAALGAWPRPEASEASVPLWGRSVTPYRGWAPTGRSGLDSAHSSADGPPPASTRASPMSPPPAWGRFAGRSVAMRELAGIYVYARGLGGPPSHA
ncbi:MAG TPA: twin-arginine translocation signal domain-containing protein [Opitutaceae bacterium]|nr:twin-arginine translocation signal domain-containing protein [Opitutaceae bacterium]